MMPMILKYQFDPTLVMSTRTSSLRMISHHDISNQLNLLSPSSRKYLLLLIRSLELILISKSNFQSEETQSVTQLSQLSLNSSLLSRFDNAYFLLLSR